MTNYVYHHAFHLSRIRVVVVNFYLSYKLGKLAYLKW